MVHDLKDRWSVGTKGSVSPPLDLRFLEMLPIEGLQTDLGGISRTVKR